MAEAIALAGIISSVIQIVDFTGKVVTHAYEPVNSSYDALRENVELEQLTQDYNTLSDLADRGDLPAAELSQDEGVAIELGKKSRREARALLNILVELKVDAQRQTMKRFWQSAQKAAKAVRKRREILKRRRLLSEINGQLATTLLLVLRQDKTKQQETLFKMSDKLQGLIKLQEKQTFAQHGQLSESEFEEEVRILELLSYDELPQRADAIPIAYQSTYEWIFDQRVTEFSSWLAHGTETYWINGKAGSGKSTLMKFIAGHEKTMELLESWCGLSNLTFAEYYFWYLGTDLQKSIEGLLRSILVQILESDIHLVRTAFPDLDNLTSWRHSRKSPRWKQETLIDALRHLSMHGRNQVSSLPASRFCFFIDGLDELSGDHIGLVRLLRLLERDLHIKLCVSSRPWNAFRMSYAGISPSLRLQDLTRSDIDTFVRGHLDEMGSSQDILSTATSFTLFPSHSATMVTLYHDLVNEIVEKAEGCFLWVHLAVVSVLRGLTEGDSFAILLERIRKLPSDLEEFFLVILSRADNVYAHHTAQVLELACLSVSDPKRSPLFESFFSYWLISQLPEGLQSLESISPVPCREFNLTDQDNMIRATESFLSACSKDLLWLHEMPSGHYAKRK